MGISEIAIVGGGCSGLLTAVQLVRHGFTGRITIVEPHEALGRGLAYSTTLDDHLARGSRVDALRELVEGFARQDEDDDAVMAGAGQ